jgi:hypothetical protein
MKTAMIDVGRNGATVRLKLKPGAPSSHAVLVMPDDVQIEAGGIEGNAPNPSIGFSDSWRESGFPPRRLTEEAIIRIIQEHGGSVKIRDEDWNIYDEIAARLGVSFESRRRLTRGTGEPAWRPEVGFCRKNLEQSGALAPTDVSGRGVWALKA